MKGISRLNRFFLDKDPSSIEDPEQIHQIKRVLRLNEGDTIIGIYQKQEYLLRINSIEKNEIKLSTEEVLPASNTELSFHLRLCLPILKGEKNELIMQKCSELGVNEFQFVHFEHSVKQNLNWDHKIQRWQKIVKEAMEQSERLVEPTIEPAISFEDLCLKEKECGIAFVERSKGQIAFEQKKQEKQNISLLFGPEGGFSPKEKELIKQKGFQMLSLGSRILRAETAIIVGTGLFSCIE